MNPTLQLLFAKKESLRGEISNLKLNDQNEEAEIAEEKLEVILEDIAEIVAKKNTETVREYLSEGNDGMEGFTHFTHLGFEKEIVSKEYHRSTSCQKR